MRKTYLIMVLGVAVSFGLGFGLGVGLGANFALVGAFGTKRVLAAMTSPEQLSARERFLACSEADAEGIPGPEELEAMLARRQARYAEPKCGVP
jgi:hypothetical protein